VGVAALSKLKEQTNMPMANPDDNLVPVFEHYATEDPVKSAAEGRKIFNDQEIVRVRFPGSDANYVFPATAKASGWITDPMTGEQTQITYAEKFRKQYVQFRERTTQTKSGTPLDYIPFLTEGKRAELKALNIYTLEALAEVDGQPLKNLGMNGRDLKNKAIEYIAETKQGAPNIQLMEQLEQLKARNTILEEDAKFVSARQAAEAEFENMSIDQLREFINANTGHTPQGSINRKTLIRMAMDARPNKAA
jgi:hypothetical protein